MLVYFIFYKYSYCKKQFSASLELCNNILNKKLIEHVEYNMKLMIHYMYSMAHIFFIYYIYESKINLLVVITS